MARISEEMEGLMVRARSSRGGIVATLRSSRVLDLTVREDWYERCSVAELEQELGGVLRDLWEQARQGRDAIMAGAGFTRPDPDRPHWNATTREVSARRAAAAYGGMSPGRTVTINSAGWREFEVIVDPEKLDEFDAAGFVAEVRAAHDDLLGDLRQVVSSIKREVYGWKAPHDG